MRFGKTIAIMTTVVTVFGAIAVIYEYNRYVNGKVNFKVNNQQANCNSIKDIGGYVESNTTVYMDTLDITDFVKVEAQTQQLDNISFLDYIKLENSNINIDTIITDINLEELEQFLNEYNLGKDCSLNANIYSTAEEYKIQPEVVGKQVNVGSIIRDIKQGTDIITIKLNNYVIEPNIKTQDLQNIVDEANKYIHWTVEYNSGQVFKGSIQYVEIVDNEVVVDDSIVKDIVRELEKVYDTAGKGFEFTTNSGDTITVTGGTYGNIMSSADEREYLTEIFNKAQSEYGRQPIMKQEYPENIGDTYLEVSIQDQHMWHYIDGELVSETDIVTGDANKRRDTPTGVYFISEKINGKYLTGADYKTWVNKWMRLTNSGVGLHDAGWRGRFGGTVYKGNGSHGCINLPKNYAYELYEVVYRGMPVIIY